MNDSPSKNYCYIASPFFDKVQLAEVTQIEEILTNSHCSYFSPRQSGLDVLVSSRKPKRFTPLTPDEMALIHHLLCDGNISIIEDCDKLVANLRHDDIGTFFEYGIFLSKLINHQVGKWTDIFTYTSKKNAGYAIDALKMDYMQGVKLTSGYSISKTTRKMDDGHTVPVKLVTIKSTFKTNRLPWLIRKLFEETIDLDSRNRMTFAVEMSNSKDNYLSAFIILGVLYHLTYRVTNWDVCFITPKMSKSNLMITRSGINQYAQLDMLETVARDVVTYATSQTE